jgi:hypothetical protein
MAEILPERGHGRSGLPVLPVRTPTVGVLGRISWNVAVARSMPDQQPVLPRDTAMDREKAFNGPVRFERIPETSQ